MRIFWVTFVICVLCRSRLINHSTVSLTMSLGDYVFLVLITNRVQNKEEAETALAICLLRGIWCSYFKLEFLLFSHLSPSYPVQEQSHSVLIIFSTHFPQCKHVLFKYFSSEHAPLQPALIFPVFGSKRRGVSDWLSSTLSYSRPPIQPSKNLEKKEANWFFNMNMFEIQWE